MTAALRDRRAHDCSDQSHLPGHVGSAIWQIIEVGSRCLFLFHGPLGVDEPADTA